MNKGKRFKDTPSFIWMPIKKIRSNIIIMSILSILILILLLISLYCSYYQSKYIQFLEEKVELQFYQIESLQQLGGINYEKDKR